MPPTSLSLKQKLSALSSAQSAPSPPHSNYTPRGGNHSSHSGSPISPTAKRKMFFQTPSWIKKSHIFGSHPQQHEVEYAYGDEDGRMVQEVLARMIFQAGVDFETRPMVVLNASALPDPQTVSYDLLLSRILSYLDMYVEADYTVVFFAAGSRYTPGWNWVWKAYRSLSRKYRKNLKQLYIVHSSFFSKMLFSLAGAIISPKFFRKMTYISTLSELALHVPITQIDISPAVYYENLKYESRITMPTRTPSNLFGVPLEDIMGYHGEKGGIPRVLKDAAQYLRDTGMRDEGLFRRSPSSALLRAVQEAYDRGNVVSLAGFGDSNLAAVLVKKYLRDLPDPIFSEATYPTIKRCPMPSGAGDTEAELATVRYIREVLLPELVPCASILLSYILHLLHDISLRSQFNRMDATNLAMMIAPNLVKGSNPVRDAMMCSLPVPSAVTGMSAGSVAQMFASGGDDDSPHLNGNSEGKTTLGMVIAFCIRRYYEIFDEVIDRSEAVSPWRTLERTSDGTESASGTYVLGEDEDPDDELLEVQKHQPPSSSSAGPSSRLPFGTKRQKVQLDSSSHTAVRSFSDSNASGSPSAWNTRLPTNNTNINGKTRSMISIESAGNDPLGTATMRRGSITIGKGTTRKGTGSAVEAVSVTAAGFFTPPEGTTPVLPPSSPTSPSNQAEEIEAEGNVGG